MSGGGWSDPGGGGKVGYLGVGGWGGRVGNWGGPPGVHEAVKGTLI